MKTFTIQYRNEIIHVTTGNRYHLTFSDGKWMIIEKYPDDTQTTPVENENISYSTAFVWVVENQSERPDWINKEELQVIGELIRRKDQELENS